MRDEADSPDGSGADRPARPRPQPAPPAAERPSGTKSRRRLGRFFAAEQDAQAGVPRPVAPGQFPGVPRQPQASADPDEPPARPRPRPAASDRPRPNPAQPN